MTGETIDEIRSDLSMFKESGVDRVILRMNAGKDYSLNETIEFFKDLKKFCQSVLNGIEMLLFILSI